MIEIERIEEEEKKLIGIKWFTKDKLKHIILENLRQYILLAMILKLILLKCIRQTISRTSWQSILKNLK